MNGALGVQLPGRSDGMVLPRPGRQWLLVLIVAIHLLAVLVWPTPARRGPGAVDAFSSQLFFYEPARPAAVIKSAPPAHERVRATVPPQAIVAVPPAVTPPPEPAQAPAPSTIAATPAPAPSMADILAQARHDIGGIDRDLRKHSLNPNDRIIAKDQTELAAKIAAAYTGGGTIFTEVTLSDGRHMTKVHTPLGDYCVYKESNNAAGRDVIASGVRTMVTTCPK